MDSFPAPFIKEVFSLVYDCNLFVGNGPHECLGLFLSLLFCSNGLYVASRQRFADVILQAAVKVEIRYYNTTTTPLPLTSAWTNLCLLCFHLDSATFFPPYFCANCHWKYDGNCIKSVGSFWWSVHIQSNSADSSTWEIFSSSRHHRRDPANTAPAVSRALGWQGNTMNGRYAFLKLGASTSLGKQKHLWAWQTPCKWEGQEAGKKLPSKHLVPSIWAVQDKIWACLYLRDKNGGAWREFYIRRRILKASALALLPSRLRLSRARASTSHAEQVCSSCLKLRLLSSVAWLKV